MKVTRVFDLLSKARQLYRKEDMVATKRSGKWIKYSTDTFVQMADSVSKSLLTFGIQPNDKVAIMSANRPEWNFCDFGIMQIGATQVPLYPTLAVQDLKFILQDSETKIVFVENKELYDKIQSIRAETPSLQEVYTFEKYDGLKSLEEFLTLGASSTIDLQPYRDAVTPEDLLTLIYTSGTTGTPKGVMLTHDNLVANFTASYEVLPKEFTKVLSFLPLSHIFERMIVYLYFYSGVSVYYAESLDTIADNIKEVQPSGFATVPRLLEKVYDKIVAKGADLSGIKKALFFWALDLGLKWEPNGKNGAWYEFQLKIANKLIFSKWREALGNNIVAIVSGGAALQPRLARVFWAAGIPVLEGYGLTETSPVIGVNSLKPDGMYVGTVGKVLPNLEVKIASDGEILCKGPSIMKGYYKKPDLTDEVIDKDGYFHTGDIGELVDGKYLKITDRKKEIFKTSGGKFIAPQIMENKFKESVYIEQIMVIGEGQRFPAALVVPSFVKLREWCDYKKIPYTTNEEMINSSEVKDKIWREVEKFNKDFGHWEQVKKIELMPREWTIDAGEMTPKLSLKRKVILTKCEALVTEIYK